MNNNRGNNRRRGRGNNRQQGGQQVNRIDSRARGNAPQLLEKYKKLAHDAHLNGDRVTEEYYLQFADHYFRVIADQRQRQEESRQPRRDERPQEYGDDYGSDYDTYGEASPSGGNERNQREEREERAPRREDREPRREEREPRREERDVQPRASAEEPEAAEDGASDADRSIYEPVENPFIRDNRAARGLKQRKPRRRDDDGEGREGADDAGTQADGGNLDPSTLPPAISARGAEAEPVGEPAPEKKRRGRPRKVAPPADEAVNG